ncbi:hypothetical protein ES703_79320 [subsurface metagenome]
MRIGETLELSIAEDDMDVNRLEQYLAREIKEFGKRVFVKALQEIEAKKLEQAKGEVGCREEVPRYLFTRLGLIRFERHKVKYKEKGKFGFFLDEILGLKPYQVATRWVRQRALELAIEIPLSPGKVPAQARDMGRDKLPHHPPVGPGGREEAER